MNGKQAKRLRRLAEANTVGLPEKSYVQRQQSGDKRKKHYYGTVVLSECTRALYKQLKKEYKNA